VKVTAMTERETKGAAPTKNNEDPREARLQALFTAAQPTAEPSSDLQRRLADLAARAPSVAPGRHRTGRRIATHWTPWRVGFGLIAAAGLALVWTAFAPIWVAAQVLRRAEDAAGAVSTAHVVTWTIGPAGSRRKASELWQQGTRSRSEDYVEQRVRMIADGRMWVYEPKLNKVTVQSWTHASAAGSTAPTLQQMLRDSARCGWNEIRRLPDTFVLGRRAHQVAIQRAGWHERGLLRVDAGTSLPVDIAFQLETDGQWITHTVMEPRYSDPLPPGIFQPNFPRTAQRFDLDHGRAEWERYLARGIARQQVGERTIVIRDIQVNAEGDLFFLYTAGKYSTDDNLRAETYFADRDWKVEVKDDLGTFYQWYTDEWASNRHMGPGAPAPFTFNGERLEGDWWIPAAPQMPWKPRRFTITFRANPVNLHDDPHAPARKAEYTATAVFTLSVAAPATALIPDYMAYMPEGSMFNEPFMRASHERSRAFYARYEQPDLAKALAHYQAIIRMHQEQARQTGQPVLDPQTWMDMGHVLRQMGRKQEARSAFEEATRDALYPDAQRRMAKEALEAVNRDLAWSVGRTASSFAGTDLDGRPQSPQRYRGQVLLINVWGTGDEKESADLPTLRALHDRYRRQGLAILGVGLSSDEPAFRKFVKERALPWPQVYEQSGSRDLLGLLDTYGSPPPPRTILIDRQGIIRTVDLHGPALQKAVTELLARV
jgi:hypothetical protein